MIEVKGAFFVDGSPCSTRQGAEEAMAKGVWRSFWRGRLLQSPYNMHPGSYDVAEFIISRRAEIEDLYAKIDALDILFPPPEAEEPSVAVEKPDEPKRGWLRKWWRA